MARFLTDKDPDGVTACSIAGKQIAEWFWDHGGTLDYRSQPCNIVLSIAPSCMRKQGPGKLPQGSLQLSRLTELGTPAAQFRCLTSLEACGSPGHYR